MTIALPLIVCWGLPITAKLSWMSTTVLPELLVFMFPRSPICLLCASGAPWVLLKGLKCPPAALQPSLRSPNWWTWNPWLPGVSPSISPEKLYFMLYFTGVTNNTLTEWSLVWTLSQFDLWHCPSMSWIIFRVHNFLFTSPFQNDQNYKLQSLLDIWNILLLKSEIIFL